MGLNGPPSASRRTLIYRIASHPSWCWTYRFFSANSCKFAVSLSESLCSHSGVSHAPKIVNCVEHFHMSLSPGPWLNYRTAWTSYCEAAASSCVNDGARTSRSNISASNATSSAKWMSVLVQRSKSQTTTLSQLRLLLRLVLVLACF